MDSQFFIGILVGLIIAYLFVRLSRPGMKKSKEVMEYIDVKTKWYLDDKTRVYLLILVLIVVALLFVYFYHDPQQGDYGR